MEKYTFDSLSFCVGDLIQVCYSQTSNELPSIKQTPPIKWPLFKFPKIGPSIFCKFDLY